MITESLITSALSSYGSEIAKNVLKQLVQGKIASKRQEKIENLEQENIKILGEELEEGLSPDKASRLIENLFAEQATVLERERTRLVKIAAREHWVALGFAAIAGIVFFGGIAFVVFGTVEQSVITLIASVAPGFLSRIFFSREDVIEKRIKEISEDLHISEQARSRLVILQQALDIVPDDNKSELVRRFITEIF